MMPSRPLRKRVIEVEVVKDDMARGRALLRAGQKMRSIELVDTMIKDRLTDVFNGYHLGITAENLAEKFAINCEEQDEFATRSQNRVEDEIAPVTIKGRKGDTIVEQDEFIRDGATVAPLTGLRPAFKKNGTVTAANASGLNDSAATLVVMSRAEAERRGTPILARVVSHASCGVDPSIMGIGPVTGHAQGAGRGRLVARRSRPDRGERGLRRPVAGRRQGTQPRPREGECKWRPHRHRPPDRRLRRAHPHHLAPRAAATRREEGFATLCIGGGMGIAMCVERI